MALGPAYARSLARKAPEPDIMESMEALDAEPDVEAPDEDADEAQLQSAYEDFAAAAGIKKSPATLRALQEIIRLTK
jgi:hypothetical protein